MTAAVEGTCRVELTCRKVLQYSCDSAVLRRSTAFRVRTTAQIFRGADAADPHSQRGQAVVHCAWSGRASPGKNRANRGRQPANVPPIDGPGEAPRARRSGI